MDVKKCSKLPPSASRNTLHRFLMVAAFAQMYLPSIAALMSSTAVLKSSIDPSNLDFDPPTQEKVTEVAIRGMQRPRDLQQLQNDSFSFEQVQDGLPALSSCTILLPDNVMTGDK